MGNDVCGGVEQYLLFVSIPSGVVVVLLDEVNNICAFDLSPGLTDKHYCANTQYQVSRWGKFI